MMNSMPPLIVCRQVTDLCFLDRLKKRRALYGESSSWLPTRFLKSRNSPDFSSFFSFPLPVPLWRAAHRRPHAPLARPLTFGLVNFSTTWVVVPLVATAIRTASRTSSRAFAAESPVCLAFFPRGSRVSDCSLDIHSVVGFAFAFVLLISYVVFSRFV